MTKRMAFLAITALLVACGGGGGHGGSPSEPQVANVAGHWTGQWSTAGLAITSTMNLTQSGSSISGNITVLGSTLQLTGSVGSSSLSWQVVGGGCGSFTGSTTFGGLNPTSMNGTQTLDTRGCSSPGFYTGAIAWTRGGLAGAAAQPGKIDDVSAAIAARQQ